MPSKINLGLVIANVLGITAYLYLSSRYTWAIPQERERGVYAVTGRALHLGRHHRADLGNVRLDQSNMGRHHNREKAVADRAPVVGGRLHVARCRRDRFRASLTVGGFGLRARRAFSHGASVRAWERSED